MRPGLWGRHPALVFRLISVGFSIIRQLYSLHREVRVIASAEHEYDPEGGS